SRLRRSNVTVAAEPVSIVRCVFCLDRHQNVIKTSGQSLADSSPNTEYQQDPTRATGTRTRESEHLQYALSRNHSCNRSSGVGSEDLKTQLRGPLLEQLHLLLAVARFVVLQALVDVLVAPLQHAIDQASELVGHGRDRFGGAEFAAKAAILG